MKRGKWEGTSKKGLDFPQTQIKGASRVAGDVGGNEILSTKLGVTNAENLESQKKTLGTPDLTVF